MYEQRQHRRPITCNGLSDGFVTEETCTVSCEPKFWIQKQETVPFKHDSLGQNRNVRGDTPAVPSPQI